MAPSRVKVAARRHDVNPPASAHHLQKELETYAALRESLAGSEGRWVAIHNDRLIGVFDSYALALQAAYAECGPDQPILVKKVDPPGSTMLVTRMMPLPCLF
jgi:hypothetical protein